jgi:hypothetical protein
LFDFAVSDIVARTLQRERASAIQASLRAERSCGSPASFTAKGGDERRDIAARDKTYTTIDQIAIVSDHCVCCP